MIKRTMKIEDGSTTYYGTVMKITGTNLGWESHGILTAHLNLSAESAGVSAGGYCLDERDPESDSYGLDGRVGTAYGLDHIMSIMRTVGVEKWEDLPGKYVVALWDKEALWGARCIGIANITDTNKMMVFQSHADTFKAIHG